MTRIGLIARADSGGLGSMTWEVHQHVEPDATVVIEMGALARGREDVSRFGDVRVSPYPMDDDALDWLLDRSDVVYTAEVPYHPDLFARARARGVRTVLHAMPELFRAEYDADEVWVPTPWEARRIPRAKVVPVPVATERFTVHEPADPPRLLHVAAPAMLDRNGTDLVGAAMFHVKRPTQLAVRHARIPSRPLVESTRVGSAWDYWNGYDDADVLVIPRRYGGLCLPVQEAAAAGVPAVMLDLDPQREWPGVERVATCGARSTPMAGGTFAVHEARAEALAVALDGLRGDRLDRLRWAARAWADGLAWGVWADRYRALLAGG